MDIEAPHVSLRDGQLYAHDFDDIYCSRSDGLAETRHVFLQHSGFLEGIERHASLCVAETGFGTGLNFLASWQAWQQRQHTAPGWLHYISVEKYPLSASQIQTAMQQWPELNVLCTALLEQYPPRRAGIYRLVFDEARIALTLCFGDAAACFEAVHFSCDCWYLDGFAPQRNQEMWSERLFVAIARHSKTGAGLSTFTAAGAVRRGLQAQGFTVEKVRGFGHKRDMIRAVYEQVPSFQSQEPWFTRPPALPSVQRVAVIGAGLAGCSVAWHAAQRGLSVDIYDAGGVANAASGNPLGLCGPHLSADNSAFTRYYFSAWHYACHVFNQLQQHSGLDIFKRCGTRHLLINEYDRDRARRLIGAACQLDEWARYDEEHQELTIAGALLVSPRHLCQAYCDSRLIHMHQQDIQSCRYVEGIWQLFNKEQQLIAEADALVCANAQAALQFIQCRDLELQLVRGQLHYLEETLPQLTHALQADVYLTPAWQGRQVLGATFQRDDVHTTLRQSDQDQLLRQARLELGLDIQASTVSGRVSFRSCGPDRMPIVGALIDTEQFKSDFADLRHGRSAEHYTPASYLPGFHVSLGHGSRGIAGTAWAAAIIIDHMTGAVSACPDEVWKAVAPQRFLMRQLKRAL